MEPGEAGRREEREEGRGNEEGEMASEWKSAEEER